jgi:hypothetical protein
MNAAAQTFGLTDKFIGFVDILGFTKMMQNASAGGERSISELFDLIKLLGTDGDRAHYAAYGPTICPQAARIRDDMDFHVTQVFDSVVVSAEVSPAGAVNLTNHCWRACFSLLSKGIMCRGYIKRGLLYHTEKDVFGPGHVEVVEKEKQVSIFKNEANEHATPFIEVDPGVVSYIAIQGDSCVKEMFSRMVRTERDLTAIFPFKRLQHSFIIGGITGPFNPQKEKASNENVRRMVSDLKIRVANYIDSTNPSAVRKGELYIRFLDDQLGLCDRTDEVIDTLMQPFPRPTPL